MDRPLPDLTLAGFEQKAAEAAAMLTDFNHSPGDIDMILYYREKEGE